MECPNCEEETDRLIEPALLRLPIDLTEACEGESVHWKEPGGIFTAEFTVTIRDGEQLVYVWDAHTERMCVGCFTHGTWPSLFPFIANKPPQVILDGWRSPVWREDAAAILCDKCKQSIGTIKTQSGHGPLWCYPCWQSQEVTHAR